jgi:hypothetical protein
LYGSQLPLLIHISTLPTSFVSYAGNIFFLSLQYIFDVKQPQDEIMVSLEQWDKRIDMDKGKANDTIGFTIMRVCCL